MSQTVDTNVLVYASNEDSERHQRARELLDHLRAGPGLVTLLWPTIVGYLRIATHPSIFPNPLSCDLAMSNVTALLECRHFRTGGEEAAFWTAYQEISRSTKPRGNLVPDAHLVALMHQHGVSTIWTADRDFRKFDGITVKDPFAESQQIRAPSTP